MCDSDLKKYYYRYRHIRVFFTESHYGLAIRPRASETQTSVASLRFSKYICEI